MNNSSLKYLCQYRFVFLLSLLLCNNLFAQKVYLHTDTVFFETNAYKIDVPQQTKINQFISFIKDKNVKIISIYGRTDDKSTESYNIELSKKRAEAVANFIKSNFQQNTTTININWYGEQKPIDNNETYSGRQNNRSVIITTEIVEPQKQAPITTTEPEYKNITIQELNGYTKLPIQEFCVDNTRDTLLVAKHGTLIYIKKNTIEYPEGYTCYGCTKVLVKEALFKSQIVAENLTTQNNNNILVSQSMVSVEFSCGGTTLPLKKGADYVIFSPTDNPVSTAGIYYGNRNNDNVFNWDSLSKTPIQSICSNFFDSNYPSNTGRRRTNNCANCKLVFCGLGKLTKGIFSAEKRKEARDFLDCRKNQLKKNKKKINNLYVNTSKANPDVPNRPDIDSCFESGCNKLYCVASLRSLELLQLRKQKFEESFRNIQQNGNPINLDNIDKIQYYAYPTSQVGSSNIDWWLKIPKSDLKTIKINLTPTQYTDCKLIFKNQRTVLAPQKNPNGYFEFQLIPKNLPAYLLLVNTKTNKPAIDVEIREFTTGELTIEPNLKSVTIQEYIELLKILDKQ